MSHAKHKLAFKVRWNGEGMATALSLSIDPTLSNRVKIGCLVFKDLKVQQRSDALWSAILSLSEELKQKYPTTQEALKDLEPTRRLYRRIGLDPTRNRPSSEALLRRVIKSRELYQVNSVVDTCNLCSLRFLLPIGLYDIDRISGPIALRLGGEGEGYDGIGKGWINVAGRLTVSDELGPFGNPSSDSARTKITAETSRVLFVIFAPYDYDLLLLRQYTDFASEKMLMYNGGDLTRAVLLPDK